MAAAATGDDLFQPGPPEGDDPELLRAHGVQLDGAERDDPHGGLPAPAMFRAEP